MLRPEKVKGFTPDQLAAFLAAQGWVKGAKNELQHTWLKKAHDAVLGHLALPQRPQLGDYPGLVALALDRFARVEDLPVSEVVEDVATLNFDTVRVRLEGGLHDQNRVRLVDASDLMQGVRQMFFAGAAGVEKRQAVYGGRSTSRVETYLQALEIAPPEPGSFVVKVLAPLEVGLEKYEQATLTGPADPFSRQATTGMLQTVEATIEAAESARKTGNIEVFKDHVQEGVSANICEALAHVTGGNPVVSVSVGASWSARRPTNFTPPRKAVVPGVLLPFIERAAPILRGKRPDDPVTVIGLVHLLKEDKSSTSQVVGIANLTPHGPRKVRVTLSPAQYKRAIDAHGSDFMVQVMGVVKLHGNLSYIDDPMEFEVLGPPPAKGVPGPVEMRRDIYSFDPAPEPNSE